MPRTDSAVAADWFKPALAKPAALVVNGLGVLDEFGIGFHHGGDLVGELHRIKIGELARRVGLSIETLADIDHAGILAGVARMVLRIAKRGRLDHVERN